MMIIHINEDGSALLRTAGYTAYYDKEGVRTGACGHLESAPESVIIHNEFKSKADKAQVSRTVDGFIKVSDSEGKVRLVTAPLTLSVETKNKIGFTADTFKTSAGQTFIKSASIDSAVISSPKINKIPTDDHIRRLVREELRQFVTRELMPGGLLAK